MAVDNRANVEKSDDWSDSITRADGISPWTILQKMQCGSYGFTVIIRPFRERVEPVRISGAPRN